MKRELKGLNVRGRDQSPIKPGMRGGLSDPKTPWTIKLPLEGAPLINLRVRRIIRDTASGI